MPTSTPLEQIAKLAEIRDSLVDGLSPAALRSVDELADRMAANLRDIGVEPTAGVIVAVFWGVNLQAETAQQKPIVGLLANVMGSSVGGPEPVLICALAELARRLLAGTI